MSAETKKTDNQGVAVWRFSAVNRVQKQMSIEIQKKWAGDEETSSQRPPSVTVKVKSPSA